MTYEVFPPNGGANPGPLPTGGEALWFSTRTLMAAFGPPFPALAWNEEVIAMYRFVPGSPLAPNAWTIIASTAGTPGNWIINYNSLTIPIRGGGLDDWPNVAAAIGACGISGIQPLMRAGTYLASSLQTTLPAGLPADIVGAGIDKTIVQSSIAAVGTNAPWLGQTTYGAAGTLAATPAVNGRTFTSNLSVAVGSWVLLSNATNAALYQIMTKAGGAPFTYTVDRAISRTFVITNAVTAVASLLNNVTLRKMTITGTGVRAINMLNAVRCGYEDIKIDGTTAAGAPSEGASWDTACLECWRKRVFVYGGGVILHGLLNEGSERMSEEDVYADRCTGIGLYVMDLFGGTITNPTTDQNANGIYIGGQGGGTPGSNDVTIVGGGAHGNSGTGLQFGLGQRNSSSGFESDGNANGIDVGAGEVATDIMLIAPKCKANTNYNFYLRASGTRVFGLDSKSATAIGIVAARGAWISGLSSANDGPFGGGQISVYASLGANTGDLIMEQVSITGAINGLYINSPTRITLRDFSIDATGNNCINHAGAAGGVLLMENGQSVGAAANGYLGAAGVTLRMGADVNFDSCGAPFTINAAGFSNKAGFFTLGAAPVAVAWPDFNNSDRLCFTQFGGGPTTPIVTAYNPGVGWTVAAGVVGAMFTWVVL